MRHTFHRVAVLLMLLCAFSISGCTSPPSETVPHDVFSIDRAEQILRDELLPMYRASVDQTSGGYHPELDRRWARLPATERSTVFQARMTWTAAEVARRRPDLRPTFEPYAMHGLAFLRDRLWDRAGGGGFAWSVAPDGSRLAASADKHAYAAAFGLYAAANVYALNGDASALALAREAFDWLETHAHDDVHGGYVECLDSAGAPLPASDAIPSGRLGIRVGLKTTNTHIHLLEAFAQLYRAAPDERVRRRLVELFDLLTTRVLAREGNWMHQTFEADWTTLPGTASFGHDIEAGYLLVDAAESLKDEARLAIAWRVARSLADRCIEVGIDPATGGLLAEGAGSTPATTPTTAPATSPVQPMSWWAQAEALNALQMLDVRYGRETPRYRGAFDRIWRFANEQMIDHPFGGWFAEPLTTDEARDRAPKAHNWKAGYHTGRALLNLADRAAR